MAASTAYLYLHISYNAMGGSGAPSQSSTKVPAGVASDYPRMVSITVSSSVPIRSGYRFLGWSMSVGGTPSIHGGQTLTHTFQTFSAVGQSYTITLYANWVQQTYTVTYLPGSYGSGSSATDTKYGGTALTLRGRLFTRSGYNQTGWSVNANGSGYAYGLGGSYTQDASITLYPYWAVLKSTITSVTSSVPADGSTQGTVQINRPVSDLTHKVVVSLGSRSAEYTNVGTSCTFTIPSAWVDQIPAATSATATVTLYSYRGSSQIGTDSKTFTITVPASVKPTVSVSSAVPLSDNSTVDGWNTLVQGYSKLRLTVSASAGTGSTIKSVVFSGDGMSQSGTGLTATSALLTNSGNRSWTVTVTDKRGRTASVTHTQIVHEYHPTSILSLTAKRSNSSGDSAPFDGTYINAKGTYSIASCNGHNSASVKKIEYKLHTASSWTSGVSSATSGTAYTFGDGNISVLYTYDVRLTVTDALNSTAVYTVTVSSIDGVSFGLNGKCARFGGPVQYSDRFECDWDAQFDGVVDVVNRRAFASLSSAGWYRVCKFDFSTYGEAYGASGGILHLNITDSYGSSANDSHTIDLMFAHSKITFANETSVGNCLNVDKIRYTFNSSSPYYGFVDIHWASSNSSYVGVSFEYTGIGTDRQEKLTSQNLISVADAPSGETVMTTYSFAANEFSVGGCDASTLITSGTLSNTAETTYTATVPCWFYLTYVLQAGSSGGLKISLNGVYLIDYTSGEALPVQVGLIPIPLQIGDSLYVKTTSNRTSSYKVFRMR